MMWTVGVLSIFIAIVVAIVTVIVIVIVTVTAICELAQGIHHPTTLRDRIIQKNHLKTPIILLLLILILIQAPTDDIFLQVHNNSPDSTPDKINQYKHAD